MKWKPPRQEHDLDRQKRYAPPRDLLEHRECDPREHIRPGRPPARENRRARGRHVRRVLVVARELERVVRLDGAAQVERGAGKETPATGRGLGRPQGHGEPRL